MDIAKYISGAKLNVRLAGLVLANRMLRKDDLARNYDAAAHTYDSEWLGILKPVTDQLLQTLPPLPSGEIYDLGCGTGYTVIALAERFPEHRINGIDISFGMITQAARKCPGAFFIHADNLHFLSEQAAESAGGIVAGGDEIRLTAQRHDLRRAGGASARADVLDQAKQDVRVQGALVGLQQAGVCRGVGGSG